MIPTINYYDFNKEKFDEIIEKYGFCVIEDILTKEKANYYISKIWDWLEGLGTGIQRNMPETWIEANWPPEYYGIITLLKVGHSQFLWDLRTEESIITVFSKIWNSLPENMLSSFDGMCVIRPPEIISTVSNWGSWFHFDQSPNKVGRHCIQSFVNLEDAGSLDGTLVVIPGSHKYHQEFFKHFNITCNIDWYRLSQTHLDWFYTKGLTSLKVLAKKGSLVLWDSRLLHCSSPPQNNRLIKSFRYTAYISMTPRTMATEYDLEIKKKAFTDMRMTNHWPHIIEIVPDILPPLDGEKDLSIFSVNNKLNINKKILSLAGF